MSKIKFYDLLDEMQKVALNEQTLYHDLVSIITYLRKVPLNFAMDSLTNLSASFMHVLPVIPAVTLSNKIEKGNFGLVLTETGRLIVFHNDFEEYPVQDRDFVLGSVLVEPGYLDAIFDLYQERERRDNFFFTLVQDEIEKWRSQGILDEKIDQAIDWITRLETVYIYSGYRHFVSALLSNTTLERWNNLSPKQEEQNVLVKIKKAPENASAEEKLLLVTLHCLYNVGGPTKFEEFNGANLTPYRLYEWLVSKYSQYFPHHSGQQMTKGLQNGVVEFSKLLGDAASKIDKTDYLRFRRMNGISFQKKEYLLKKDSLLQTLDEIPAGFIKLAEQMGLEVTSHDHTQLFAAMLKKAYEYELSDSGFKVKELDPACEGMNWLEYVLYTIVKEAALLCDLDYCFTSGLKDISKLYGTEYRDNRVQAISLAASEMFCCFNDLNKPANIQVCEGMQGNRWNYLGGNIDHKLNKEQGRYYRFPLLFPDVSVHNDYHHEGHTRLNVKHLFRVSGPLLDSEPLEINGIGYRSFFDIRGVRNRDIPFSIADLENAIKICKYLDVIWRTVVELYETKQQIVPIQLFDLDYYGNLSH